MIIEDLKQVVKFTLTQRTLGQLHELVAGGHTTSGTAAVTEAVNALYERQALDALEITEIDIAPLAMATIEIARLPGENDLAVISRLLIMLLPIANDLDTFFGAQIAQTNEGE